MDKVKISIVIPVYNAEDYLERCIQSILAQNFSSYEVILVDDGSSDASSLICDRYSATDPRFRTIHKPNGGLSDARNVGVAHATTDYIIFIDADDIFDNGFALEKLKIALENDPRNQVIGGNFLEVQRAEDDNIIYFFDHNENLVWVFGKIYKRKFLNKYNIRFHPTSRANEDTGFNTLCLLYANEKERIAAIDEPA